MTAWRLLLTGPTMGLDRWHAALAKVPAYVTEELEVLDRPVLELVPRALAPIVHRPDWLCLTSQSALPSLELRWRDLSGVKCAVVGERSAEELGTRGLAIAVGPTKSARELLERWLPQLRPAERVLWPRGTESDEVARSLRTKGVLVDDPVAYETRTNADRRALPAAELVFFASPSAVRAFGELERVESPHPMTAIAIGPTTTEALESLNESPFARLEELDAPKPAALVRMLERLRRTAP